MNEKTPRYITTTLPYVNADPHIGFGLEVLQADALARYARLMGYEVFFNTGTDEHGQKIAQKADEKGEDRQVYVDHFAREFNRLKEGLNLSYDNFIRTSNPAHKKAAQHIWKLCDEAGDIYKKKYKGLYCVGCESFKTDSDLVDGKCPDHQKEPEEIEEENYFFKLSKYQSYLEEYLSQEGVIEPEWRRLEALKFVQGGLEDLSISREIARMDWGIPVPGDDEHVMYVWFDALTNYISTLGWPSIISVSDDSETKEDKPTQLSSDDVSETKADKPTENLFEKFWVNGQTLQLAGKDQIRFQSIIWQAMLKSAGIKATDKIIYHGFINSGGQKMSKSLGNVISPYELIDKYGTDAARYILLRHVHPFDDSDLTWGKMDEYYTANLVNGLGNLTARIMKMAETHLDTPIDRPEVSGFDEEYLNALDTYNLQAACDVVWKKVQALDEKIAETEPFKLVKTDKDAAVIIIKELVTDLYTVGRMLFPIMPEANVIIKEAVLANKKPDNLFNRLEK